MITETQAIKPNDITWGIDGHGEATVLCHQCNQVFGKAPSAGKAQLIKQLAEGSHFCKVLNA